MANLVKKVQEANSDWTREDIFSTIANAVRPTPVCWWCKSPMFDDEITERSSNGDMHTGCAAEFKNENTQN